VTGHTSGGTTSHTADAMTAQALHEDGWYLYGITSADSGGRAPAPASPTHRGIVDVPLDLGLDHLRLQLLRCGNLAALVRRVPQADFTPAALQDRLGDPTTLARAAQVHNSVIHAIHQRRAILPARFGAVYARLDDLIAAMDQRSDFLLEQLARLDGCDEWAVHVYVDRRIVRASILAEQAQDQARQQLATASPGRAYLLRRKLDEGLAVQVAQVAEDLAVAAYQRLVRVVVDGVANRPASPDGDPDGDVEELRAALLVRREQRAEFIANVRAAGHERAVRLTHSGPWPPYSFAAITEGDGDDRQDA
jgi:hypothetical protein